MATPLLLDLDHALRLALRLHRSLLTRFAFLMVAGFLLQKPENVVKMINRFVGPSGWIAGGGEAIFT